MQRRSLRLVAGLLVLALPLLGSCGFDRKTNAIYTPAAGTNDRSGDVDVLAAVVVAAQPGSGTFIATLSNSSTTDADSFDALAGAGDWADLQIAEITPIEIPARGFVNLADDGGVEITGDFGAGDMMQLSLTFQSGQTTTMNVPVVYACDEYSGLDSSGGGASTSSSASSSASESPSPGDVPTDDATASPSEADSTESSSEDSSASAAPSSGESYDCAAVLGEE